MAFADLPKYRGRNPQIEAIFGGHVFDRVGGEHGIRHRRTRPYHPPRPALPAAPAVPDRGLGPRWTNGQAERMHRTVQEATVKALHHPDLEALRAYILAFVTASNFARHLKAWRWRTPFQAVRDAWQADPSAFKIDPHHRIPGPNG